MKRANCHEILLSAQRFFDGGECWCEYMTKRRLIPFVSRFIPYTGRASVRALTPFLSPLKHFHSGENAVRINHRGTETRLVELCLQSCAFVSLWLILSVALNCNPL